MLLSHRDHSFSLSKPSMHDHFIIPLIRALTIHHSFLKFCIYEAQDVHDAPKKNGITKCHDALAPVDAHHITSSESDP
jgi:hypothetical protein